MLEKLLLKSPHQVQSYKISTESPRIMVSVSKINDAERPRISLVSNANNLSIIEGKPFEVGISADPAPATELAVEMTVLADGFFDVDLLRTVMIPPTGRVDKMIETQVLGRNRESNITILVRGNEKYFVSASANFISIRVLSSSEDVTPVVSVIPESPRMTMGETAHFDITVQPVPDTTLRVNLSIQTVGDVQVWRGVRWINLDGRKRVSLPTIPNRISLNGSSTLRVTVLDGAGYTVSRAGADVAEITVNPIEIASDSETLNSNQVAIADSVLESIMARLNENTRLQSQAIEVPLVANAPIINLPKISVVAAFPVVEEGNSAIFNLSGDQNIQDRITIDYTLTPKGDFFGGLSVEVRTTELSKRQRLSQVEITTVDDAIAEADGALILTLIKRDDYDLVEPFQAGVVISDLLDRQQQVADLSLASQDILPDMTGAIAARTLGIASNRIGNAFSGPGGTSTFNYNGNENLTSLIEAGGEALNAGSIRLREVLGHSSFTISLFPETQGLSLATIWGIGDYRDLNSGEGLESRAWDADVFTGHIGLDTRVGQELLVGITAAVTESNIDHTGATEGELTFKSRTTALNPYLGWTSSDQDAELRAVAGYGVGEIDIEQTNYELQTVANTYHTIGISGNQRIYASDSILEGGTSELSITGQSWYARQNLFGVEGFINSMQTDASHYRIGIEGSHTQNLVSGSTLIPTVSVGLRGDGKDNQTIFGMEVGSGLSHTSNFGLTFTGNSNMLLIEQGEIQKWSLFGTVKYDRGNDYLGTIMEISPSYGQMESSNSRSLWSSDILESVSETGQYMDGTKVDTELSYGLSILDDTSQLTPFGGIGYSDDTNNKYHVGTRLQLGSDLKFELTGTQETDTEGTLNQKIKLDGAFNW